MPIQTVLQSFSNRDSGSFAYRNLIINGAMEVAQRGTSFNSTAWNNGKSLDRYHHYATGGGAYSVAQSTDVPTNSGLKNSMVLTVGTTDSSIGSSDHYIFIQRVEGKMITPLVGGLPSGIKQHTVSFWFKTSVSQTYSFTARLVGSDSTYSYSVDFTPTALNTWERKIITIPTSTVGSPRTNEDEGYSFLIGLANGSNFQTTPNTWSSGNYHSSTNIGSSWINTSGATFYITGCQLELGSEATPFEYRPLTIEEQLCYRYYYTDSGGGGSIGYMYHASTGDPNVHYIYKYPVKVRTTPTITITVSNTTAGTQYVGVNSCECFASQPGTSGESRINTIIVDAEI